MTRRRQPSRTQSQEGVVLFTVVLLVALLSLVVLLLLVQTTHNRNRARSFLDAARAEMLVDVATQEVMAKLMDGGEIPWHDGVATASMTAGPGMIEQRRYDVLPNRGYQQGRLAFTDRDSFVRNPFADEYERGGPGDWQPANPRLINLYSHRWYAPAIRYMTVEDGVVDRDDGNPDYNPSRRFNINTVENPFFPGELYLSGASGRSTAVKDRGFWHKSAPPAHRGNQDQFRFRWGEVAADRPVWVQWLPIHKFPNKPPVFTNAAGTVVRNPLVGRYAYWVDVENTKVNLRTSDRLYEESDWHALLGEADVKNPNLPDHEARVFEQRVLEQNPATLDPAVLRRYELEKGQMSYRFGPGNRPRTHQMWCENLAGVDPGNNDAPATYLSMWLDWRAPTTRPDGSTIDGRPYAADTSMVDWKTFTGIRPHAGGLGDDITIEGLLNQAAQRPDLARFNTVAEGFSLLDPAVEQANEFKGLTALAAMRRTYGNAVTIHGWDEERDPLGRPRIDIAAFQREYAARGPGGPVWNDLESRLRDPAYYNAYYPGAYPTGGRSISYAQMFNLACGDSNPANDNNGLEAVRQLMVNIGEYAVHPDTPPHIDEARGIVGARSMPYVCEVATRARNGLWDAADDEGTAVFDTVSNLVEQCRVDTNAVADLVAWTDAAGANPLGFYVTNAVIDLCFGMVNPNPFATTTSDPTDRRDHRFNGELQLDYEWAGDFPPEYAETQNGAYTPTAPVDGLYVARPIPLGFDEKHMTKGRFWASGTTPYFKLGLIPGGALEDPARVRALRIKGWTIRQHGQVYHKVPIKHPGQTAPVREWWAMAQGDNNVGPKRKDQSLHWYRGAGGKAPFDQFQHVAVGWFTGRHIVNYAARHGVTGNVGLTNLVYMHHAEWTRLTDDLGHSNDTVRAAAADRFQSFLGGVRTRDALVERVAAKDVTVGHRTGNDNARLPIRIAGDASYPDIANPKGHFFGANGHPWRRLEPREASGGRREIRLETRPVRGPRPPPETITVVTEVPAGNTVVQVPREVTVQRPAPIIGTRTVEVSRVVSPSLKPDSVITLNFTRPVNRAVEQEAMGFNAHDLLLGYKKNNWGAPLAAIEYMATHRAKENRTGVIQCYDTNREHQGFINNTFSFFSSAPRGDLMTSIGELGFVHSGLMLRPIDFTNGRKGKGAGGRSQLNGTVGDTWIYLNSPQAGPGMQMLLDLFTPGAFRDNDTYAHVSESDWRAGAYTPNSPAHPRRGVWNINATVAQDGYLAVREGGYERLSNERRDWVARKPIHPYWAPSAFSPVGRMPDPATLNNHKSEGFHRGLDPNMNPACRFRRGWESWISVVGGDFTPYRTKGYGVWQRWNEHRAMEKGSYYSLLPAANFCWNAGGGAAPVNPFDDNAMHNVVLVDFDPDYGGAAQLLIKGGMHKRHNAGPWYIDISQRPSADTLYPVNAGSTRDLYSVARYDAYPVRHHLSEIVRTGNDKNININSIATALNPWTITSGLRQRAGGKNDFWQQGHAGRFRESGVFANAPVALVANQISTSANVFTIHVVAQALTDNGEPRGDKGTPSQNVNTGTGFMDATDDVTAEHWARVVVAKVADRAGRTDPRTGGPLHDYKVLYSTVREHAR